jgi:hypothetical protein
MKTKNKLSRTTTMRQNVEVILVAAAAVVVDMLFCYS